MDFLASLPNWAILVTVGALAGVIGGAFAWFGHRRIGPKAVRFVPVIAVAAGLIYANASLIPAIASSDAAACVAAERAAELTNRTQAGTALDAITIVTEMLVDCETKSVTYDLAVDADMPAPDDPAWGTAFAAFNATQCNHPDWRGYIDNGWMIANLYSFRGGATRRLVADCDV